MPSPAAPTRSTSAAPTGLSAADDPGLHDDFVSQGVTYEIPHVGSGPTSRRWPDRSWTLHLDHVRSPWGNTSSPSCMAFGQAAGTAPHSQFDKAVCHARSTHPSCGISSCNREPASRSLSAVRALTTSPCSPSPEPNSVASRLYNRGCVDEEVTREAQPGIAIAVLILSLTAVTPAGRRRDHYHRPAHARAAT